MFLVAGTQLAVVAGGAGGAGTFGATLTGSGSLQIYSGGGGSGSFVAIPGIGVHPGMSASVDGQMSANVVPFPPGVKTPSPGPLRGMGTTEQAPRGEDRLLLKIHPSGLREFYYRMRTADDDTLIRIGSYEPTPGYGGSL